jgi:hypothetical protein
MTDEIPHYYITPPTLFLPPTGLRVSLVGVDEDWIDNMSDELEDTLPSIPMTFYHLDTKTSEQWQWQFHMMEQSNLIVVNVARCETVDLLLSFLHIGDNKIWFYVDPDEVDKNIMTLLNTINANVFANPAEFHSMLTAFIGNA